MPRDFYPRREADIVSFTSNLSARINFSPSEYGLSEIIAQNYAIKQQAFAEAFVAVQSNSSNSTSAVSLKEERRIVLERETRRIVRMVKGQMTVTDEMRINVGLKPNARRRQHVPVPGFAPKLTVKNGGGTVLGIELLDAETNRIALPRDVRHAYVMTYIGEHPPADVGRWSHLTTTFKARFEARFHRDLPPGTTIWLTACWQNPRGQRGPWSEPVRTRIQFDGPLQSVTLSKAA